MTDAWIAVGIFIIFFEILYLILHFIFSRQYKKNIQRIDDEFRKKSEAELQFEKELEEKQKNQTIER